MTRQDVQTSLTILVLATIIVLWWALSICRRPDCYTAQDATLRCAEGYGEAP